MFGVKGFDIVLGNPPYIGEKGNKEIFEPLKKSVLGQSFYNGKMDLFYFFFHLGLDLLKPSGIISFVTTNYYITATGGAKLRKDFADRSNVVELINFGELKVFESALGQHNLITTLQKKTDQIKSTKNAKTTIVRSKGYLGEGVLSSIINKKDKQTDYYTIPQDQLFKSGNIQLTAGRIDNVLDKLLNNTITLGSICEVNMGIQTGADFVGKKLLERASLTEQIDDIFINDPIYIISDISKFSNIEKREVLKRYIKNSSISKYCINEGDTSNWLIYLDSKTDIMNYPNIYAHLSKFRKILSFRQQVNNLDNNWFWIRGAKRNFLIDTGNHIICPYRSVSNTFSLTDGKTFGAGDIYFITQPKNGYNLKFLLGVLNSKIIYKWLYYRGKRKGEMLELYQEPLSKIPIPILSTPHKQKLASQVENLVEEILEIKARSGDTSALELQIDQLVYQLYDLTEEEITIICDPS